MTWSYTPNHQRTITIEKWNYQPELHSAFSLLYLRFRFYAAGQMKGYADTCLYISLYPDQINASKVNENITRTIYFVSPVPNPHVVIPLLHNALCWTITNTPDISEHGPLLQNMKNPSNNCVIGSYPPATKSEKSVNDVRCKCPSCSGILTWEEMNKNVSLYNKDFITNGLRRLHDQELKTAKITAGMNVMEINVILPLTVKLWSREKIKAMFNSARLKITRECFFLVSFSISVHPLQGWLRSPEEHMLSDLHDCMIQKCSLLHIH